MTTRQAVEGLDVAQGIEQGLEIQAGRAAAYYGFQCLASQLVSPGKADGGLLQFGIQGRVLLSEYPGTWGP